MKHIATIILFVLYATEIFAQRAEILEIQSLSLPETIIDFGDDPNIAIVAIHYQKNVNIHKADELFLDSLLVNAIANGIKEGLENSPLFEDFDVPIYNIYGDVTMIDIGMQKDELDAIYEQSRANVVVAIEYLYIKYDTITSIRSEKKWINASFYVAINTYDVKIGTNVKEYKSKSNLIFLAGYDEIKSYRASPKVEGLKRRGVRIMGYDYAKRIVPIWETAKRMIFCDRKNDNFSKAYKSAIEEQDWATAAEHWTDVLFSEKTKDSKKAQAMYNLALAYEMLENFDLSLKWLGNAKKMKTRINESIREYENILKLRIGDREILDEIFNKNKF